MCYPRVPVGFLKKNSSPFGSAVWRYQRRALFYRVVEVLGIFCFIFQETLLPTKLNNSELSIGMSD